MSSSTGKPSPLVRHPVVAWWKRWARLAQHAIDAATDAALGNEPRSRARSFRISRRLALCFIVVLIAIVGGLDYITGDAVDAGIFYHLPIILACALFGFRGIWVMLACFGLYLGNEGLVRVHAATRASSALFTPPVPYSFGNDISHLGSFSIIAALTLFARNLHLSLAEKSRELVVKQQMAESEMALAERVQRCLFNIPDAGYEDDQLAIYAHSTSLSRIGGDFCRLAAYEDAVTLFVGDVVGKGVPAALVMTMCITALEGEGRGASSPALDLERCNEVLFNSFTDEELMTATACVATFNRRTSELVFSLAGHEPPIVLSDIADPDLWQPGILMGAVPRPEYPLYRIPLWPGERAVLFTDGATEARSPEGEQFGRDRLEAAARRFAHLPSRDALHAIRAEIEAYVGDTGLRDDLTLVVMERNK